ncbi:hypothetical protein [Calothrix sp. UHCC 0171]|uniref:hypothetical protein n=1 Tax=Calothrix sp. UHCC 0171 TaxID=3110245 RepID=UPI002B218FD5|nr:hypothetical protein [Calothrix sp. UHCC 0171]MEA5570086.1 hypothetical protein [Calothrix sp. UHCC 0171]
MNAKLINILTVSLVTFAVLVPEILVFGFIWQNHLQFEQNNSLISSGDSLHNNYVNNILLNTTDVEKIPISNGENHGFIDWLDTFKIILLLELLLFSLPMGLVLIFFLYDRYLIHRNISYQQRVELLEKIWHYDIDKKEK